LLALVLGEQIRLFLQQQPLEILRLSLLVLAEELNHKVFIVLLVESPVLGVAGREGIIGTELAE
jgi:hypothetical protein